MTSYFLVTDQPHQALETGHRALSLAESSQDFGLQIDARFRVSVIHRILGDYRQAITLLTENINALCGDLQYEMFGGVASVAVTSRNYLIQCHNALGQFTASKRLQAEAVEIAETMHNTVSLVFAYGVASSVCVMQGDVQQAIPRLERSRALCQTHHITLMYQQTLLLLSLAYALAQRDTEALQLLDDVMPRQANIGRFVRPIFIETLFLTGRVEDALAYATEALNRYTPEESKVFRAETFRLLGDIHASSNLADVETAEGHYHESLALANELGMRPLQAHCHRGLGKLYRRTGQSEQARTELTTAIEMYRDMEMTFWLPETETALAAVESKV
jgi:tetratricopeptide (TPR) repeat protein